MGRISLACRQLLVAVCVAGCFSLRVASAADPPADGPGGQQPPEAPAEPDRLPASPTFGGRQFWSDHLVFHDYRIQRNVFSGHYRLLDAADRRRAWGSFATCRAALSKLKQTLDLPPLGRRVVIVLHGLGRSRQSMEGLVEYLRDASDFTVLNVSYASTRCRIAEHAATLAKVVEHLRGVDEVHFVGHSMGNLVVRHYLHDLGAGPTSDHASDNRVGRIVMLAPPNQGAVMAERFRKNPVFRLLWGTSGGEIADWETLAENLAVPPGEFAIVAGGKGDEDGYNPLIAGDDDFVVSVVETRLPGAHDFLVVPEVHAVIMDHSRVREATLRFLQEGHLVSAAARTPLGQ